MRLRRNQTRTGKTVMNRTDFSLRPLLPETFGPIQQVAYVVEDLNEAVRYWRQNEAVSPFLICNDISPFTRGSYRGSDCSDTTIHVAFAYIDGMQLELIEVSSDAPSIYHEALQTTGDRVHHYAVHTREFAKTFRWALDNGYTVVLDSGIDGLARMSYLAHERCDFIIELIELNPLTQPYFDGIESRWKQLESNADDTRFNVMTLTRKSAVFRAILGFLANSLLGRIDRTRA